MTTLTTTSLDKKQITLTLRPTRELGAEPNVFVSAEVFAQFKAEAATYDRDTAIAELKELSELALANKDYNVVRKIIADIIRLKKVKRGSFFCKEIFLPADADLAALPVGSTFDEIVQAGLAYAVKEFHVHTKKEDLAEINSDTALHHSSATEQANQRKSVASIVGERMKLLAQKHKSEEFTKEIAYASFEELRRVSMQHGGLNTARLLIRDKCEICDILSLHARRLTKSPKELTAPSTRESNASSTKNLDSLSTEEPEVNLVKELRAALKWDLDLPSTGELASPAPRKSNIFSTKMLEAILMEDPKVNLVQELQAALTEEQTIMGEKRAALMEEQEANLMEETISEENMNWESGTDPP